jgi:hypothetical protein
MVSGRPSVGSGSGKQHQHSSSDDDDNGNDNSGDGTNDNSGDDTNDNSGDDTNDNSGDDNGNDNSGDGTNDNSGDDTNDNSGDNTNDNTNDNSDGLCPGGLFSVEGEFGDAAEAEYRELSESCRRFRVEIEGFVSGSHDVFINDMFIDVIMADSDGEGRLRLETEDGTFPAEFPEVMTGDSVFIGDLEVILEVNCPEDMHVCDNANGNDNTGDGAGNDNSGDEGNDNGN